MGMANGDDVGCAGGSHGGGEGDSNACTERSVRKPESVSALIVVAPNVACRRKVPATNAPPAPSETMALDVSEKGPPAPAAHTTAPALFTRMVKMSLFVVVPSRIVAPKEALPLKTPDTITPPSPSGAKTVGR